MPSTRPASLALVLVALAGAIVSFPSASLYIYVPDILVISSSDDADSVLAELEVSFGVQPSDGPIYADRPDLKRLDRTARIMERHWLELDAQCNANAVFALMYLTTTYGVRFHIQNEYFADNDYLSIITVSFAKLYLDAYHAWAAGDLAASPRPWREAFDWAMTGTSSITEDEFLGMNAHINYDLAVAIAGLGTHNAAGESRKPDMDRINHVLADVTDDVGYQIAKYYGPAPPTTQPNWGEGHETTPENAAVLEGIFLWREQAWQNAVLIESAPDASSREAHDNAMEEYAGTVAEGLQTPKLAPTAPERVAYCQANP